MTSRFLVLLPGLLFGGLLSGKAQPRPQWMHRVPEARNATYLFVPVTVDASSLQSGRHESLKMLALDRSLLSTLEMRYRGSLQTDTHAVEAGGNFSERIETHSIDVVEFDGRTIRLSAHIVDEYIRHGRMTTLYQVGVVPSPSFDPVSVTTRYGGRGLWRSALIPGWGQYHKGAALKGSLILGGSALLAGGIVFFDDQRRDYLRKIARTHDRHLIDSYTTRSDHMATARNVTIGALAALYVYNLVDAVAAPGARRVVVRKQRTGPALHSFAPAIGTDGTPLLAATLVF